MPRSRSLSTRSIHDGEHGLSTGSPNTPLFGTSTFVFESTADMEAVVSGAEQGNLYTRYGFNPTIKACEEKLASLEDADDALVFASGMAALTAAFITHGRGPVDALGNRERGTPPGGIVSIGDAYGGTMEALSSQLPQIGIPVTLLTVEQARSGRLEEALEAGASMVFFETPTNPTLGLIDIAVVSRLAKAAGAKLVVDNTFASPVNQQPLSLGADLVIHSATKFLGGHSDLTAGCVMGSSELVQPIWNWRKNLGTTPSPETAALLARSLRTLVVRVTKHNQSAMAIAEAMESHPAVKQVWYPGLGSHPDHALARRQMHGYGGMVTIEVHGGRRGSALVGDRLELFGLGPSLGAVESLAVQPVSCTHYHVPAAERQSRGITDGMIRLSVGLEDVQDLMADLDQALQPLRSVREAG